MYQTKKIKKMMAWFRYALLSGCLLVMLVINSVAQDKCEQTLTQATEAFAAGHFNQIPIMLKACIDEGQKKEWRQRAYLLLAQTYLLLEDPVGAENSYLEVLRANPEYTTNSNRDPIDLVYLSSKFTASPIFSLYATGGANVSFVRSILNNETTSNVSQHYFPSLGFHIGAGVEWHYNDNLSATLEGNYLNTAYRLEKTLFVHDKITLNERQSWVRFPLAIKYTEELGKFRPYGYVGLSVDLMIGSRVVIEYEDRNIDPVTGQFVAESEESLILKFRPKRNTLNRSWFVGGGAKYKIGLNYVFADVRYSFGMTNVVDVNNYIYDYSISDRTSGGFESSGDGVTTYAHIDDFFRMDNVVLSIGYVHPLYKPRKLKKARSKSVFRSIKKQQKDAPKN